MSAAVFLNDASLGEFGPYTPFEIDVTDRLADGENRLRVELDDLGGKAPWGRDWVTAFPRLGGIIRDVTLLTKPAVYIENARLDYDLVDSYRNANVRLQVWVRNTTSSPVEVTPRASLSRPGHSLDSTNRITAPAGISRHEIAMSIEDVALWSPESPALYELTIDLSAEGQADDRFESIAGFKEFVTRGRDLYLNGQKYFLKGIFRHDIYGDQGHTLTRAQMEAEIADIKSLGCNYLRLGHYPHHAYIGELAARLGLLTSGEPPVFGQDQDKPEVVEGAKFCLGGLIRRDWNNPAAAFWIIANESGTRPGYMKEMARYVRDLDASRLVTIVDNTKLERNNVPWKSFRESGIDFICQNAYGSAFDGYCERLLELAPDDLPLVISEWGGTSNSRRGVLAEGIFYLERSNERRESGPRLAGISFWEYQDIPMRRWTEEGLLHWSIVDVDRRPYETYYGLKTLYTGKTFLPPRGRLLVPNMDEDLPRPLALPRMERHADYETLDLSAVVNSREVVAALNAVSPLAYPEKLPLGQVAIAGLPFRLEEQLVALSAEKDRVRVPIDRRVEEFEFLGHVCFNSNAKAPEASFPELPFLMEGFPNVETPVPFGGYPQGGEFGEIAAEYSIEYEDGEREVMPLANGVHLADYRLFFGLSPIDAVATDTERAVRYQGDFGAKTYQLRLFAYRPAHPEKRIASLEFSLSNKRYVPLLAAITILRSE